MSRPSCPGPIRFDPFASALPARTPGTLGVSDCGTPHFLSLDDTHRLVLGLWPELNLDFELPHWDDFKLRSRIWPHLGADYWDYDQKGLLDEPKLNPEFAGLARAALDEATSMGFRPKVHQAYRSPEESERLYKKYKAGKGGRAAPAWMSCHNYGLAMDVWLHDAKGKVTWNDKLYKQLSAITDKYDLVWGGSFNDYDHFEYHPNWKGGAGGALLKKAHEWAVKASAATPGSDWLNYFWWAAGAGGESPAAQFLTANPAPLTKT